MCGPVFLPAFVFVLLEHPEDVRGLRRIELVQVLGRFLRRGVHLVDGFQDVAMSDFGVL